MTWKLDTSDKELLNAPLVLVSVSLYGSFWRGGAGTAEPQMSFLQRVQPLNGDAANIRSAGFGQGRRIREMKKTISLVILHRFGFFFVAFLAVH